MKKNNLPKVLSLLLIVIMLFGCQSKKETTLLFVGSYTDKKPGKGISIYEFNNETGEATLKFWKSSCFQHRRSARKNFTIKYTRCWRKKPSTLRNR